MKFDVQERTGVDKFSVLFPALQTVCCYCNFDIVFFSACHNSYLSILSTLVEQRTGNAIEGRSFDSR